MFKCKTLALNATPQEVEDKLNKAAAAGAVLVAMTVHPGQGYMFVFNVSGIPHTEEHFTDSLKSFTQW